MLRMRERQNFCITRYVLQTYPAFRYVHDILQESPFPCVFQCCVHAEDETAEYIQMMKAQMATLRQKLETTKRLGESYHRDIQVLTARLNEHVSQDSQRSQKMVEQIQKVNTQEKTLAGLADAIQDWKAPKNQNRGRL